MTTHTATQTAATQITAIDPRPYYRAALTWVAGLIAAVPAERLTDPTPCDGFDVRTLLGHLVTTVRRARVIAEGRRVDEVPFVSTGIADDELAGTYAADADAACAAWAEDARLDVTVVVPWGEVPGRGAVWAYLSETLVHGWDLAVATRQHPEADPDTARAALAAIPQTLPAEPRGGPVPFDPPVEPADGAGPTERLANWAGHRR